MNIVFFGNTKYSVIVAKALFEHFGLAAIITIPDSPIKTFASVNNIPVLEIRTLADGYVKQIQTFNPDFLVVCDYGLFLPDSLMAIP